MPDIIKTRNIKVPVPEETPAVSNGIMVTADKAVIVPEGRLDTVTSGELKDRIAEYDLAGKDIEVDFKDVEYISSAGLRLLVALQKQAKSGGRTMVIRNINSVVKEVFRVSGFDKAFTVV